MREILIGFDARVVSLPKWDSTSRDTFLLNNQVNQILSADSIVWPSVFTVLDIELELPEKLGYVQGLWSDLDRLKHHMTTVNASYKLVAFTQFYDNSMIEETGLTVLPFNPSSVQKDWQFLGYDVAEQTLLSGLTNMGYRETDKSYGVEKFASALNEYHLFENLDIAQKFVSWTQSRDPGHGPWFVTGIYGVSISQINS